MFSLCPSVSHHFSWALDVFELFREEAGDERDQDSCQNLPICCLKFSFVADACAQLHLEVEEDPAQYLHLSFPFSASRVLNLQSSSLGYACTNIGSSCLPWLLALTLCIIYAYVSQWGLARRVIMIGGEAGKQLADPEGRFITSFWWAHSFLCPQ